MNLSTSRRLCVLVVGTSVLLPCGLWAAEPSQQNKDLETPVSFELDVMPVLTVAGCNSGACHGKQRGQNGFQLSLLGYDSQFDFDAITRDARGRRLFPAVPSQSLLLRKAVADLPHGGGRKIDPDSRQYQTLLDWIRQGAQRRLENEPVLESIAVDQSSMTLKPNETASIGVKAHYSDGTSRDVTSMAGYLPNETAVAKANELGVVTAGELPGETAVMVRYMNHIEVVDVVIPQAKSLPAKLFDELPRANFIDDLVYAKLQTLSIQPSPEADAATVMRRLHLDLIGRLPTPGEARDYLQSNDSNKKAALVDKLLRRGEYADHWAGYWADLLRPNPYRVGIKAVLNYDNWIRRQFRDNVPYDEFVRRLVTASGSTWHNGAVTLYRDRRSPDEIATITSQLFLGIRLECAKCHHHPFERWSQQDFYQFAAHFAELGRKGKGLSPPISGAEEFIFDSNKGSVKHPVTGEALDAIPLYSKHAETPDADVSPRDRLAQWMTKEHDGANQDYFAEVQVNRVWSVLMGRGIVMPVDDLRATNPPTNPVLLAKLAEHFRDVDFDLKRLIKTIVMSNVYARSSIPTESNVGDRLNYSRHYRHPLRAEVLFDAICDVTETNSGLPAMAPDARANQVWTTRVDSLFLDTFGRPNENQDPPCERISDATVTQALHLMNSVKLDARIRNKNGRVTRLAESDLTPREVADEIYLATLSRFPTEKEQSYVTELVAGAQKRRDAIEDVIWALLNSPEFSIQN